MDEKYSKGHTAASVYNNMGSIYVIFGDNETALEHYTKALQINQKILGEEHPENRSLLP